MAGLIIDDEISQFKQRPRTVAGEIRTPLHRQTNSISRLERYLTDWDKRQRSPTGQPKPGNATNLDALWICLYICKWMDDVESVQEAELQCIASGEFDTVLRSDHKRVLEKFMIAGDEIIADYHLTESAPPLPFTKETVLATLGCVKDRYDGLYGPPLTATRQKELEAAFAEA